MIQYRVNILKTGEIIEMDEMDLFNKFSRELSMHLIKLESVTQVSLNSNEYGKVLIRKEE